MSWLPESVANSATDGLTTKRVRRLNDERDFPSINDLEEKPVPFSGRVDSHRGLADTSIRGYTQA